jgi:hypothetical protein
MFNYGTINKIRRVCSSDSAATKLQQSDSIQSGRRPTQITNYKNLLFRLFPNSHRSPYLPEHNIVKFVETGNELDELPGLLVCENYYVSQLLRVMSTPTNFSRIVIMRSIATNTRIRYPGDVLLSTLELSSCGQAQ